MNKILAALCFSLVLSVAAHAQNPAGESDDYRTVITPVVRQAMDRQLYSARDVGKVESRKRWKRAWIASWAAFAAANLLDANSSAGKIEANPLLRASDGTFSGGRATAIKASAGIGLFAYQAWAIHKSQEKNLYKGFTVVNSAAAGGLAAIAARNSGK